MACQSLIRYALYVPDNREFVEVQPALRLPATISGYESADNTDEPFHLRFMCTYQPASGRYEIDEVHVIRRGQDHEPVTSAGLRRVRAQEWIRRSGERYIRGIDDGWRPATNSLPRPRSESEYRDAAREYVAARVMGDPPLERVAHVYGVSKPTATRIVAEARERGFSTDG